MIVREVDAGPAIRISVLPRRIEQRGPTRKMKLLDNNTNSGLTCPAHTTVANHAASVRSVRVRFVFSTIYWQVTSMNGGSLQGRFGALHYLILWLLYHRMYLLKTQVVWV